MRLGGPVFGDAKDPAKWAALVREAGYRAAYSPCSPEDDDVTVKAFCAEAAKHDIVMAEVGAWSNPISPSEPERRAALEKCVAGLALAERMGARCCVNIAGSRNAKKWDGPDRENLTQDTFDLVVESVRTIIDQVKPTRTFYTLETMPWVFPHSTASYLALVKAIDRPAFGVHFDPVNLVVSPEIYFNTGALIRDFVEKLGPWLRSVHAKDTLLSNNLTLHLDEARPGLGNLDYEALLTSLSQFEPDLSVMLEHLPSEEEYRGAASHLKKVAKSLSIPI